MRVFLLIFLAAVSTTAFADSDHALMVNGQANVVTPEKQSVAIFGKKKRIKSSNKVKKHNRSMGKKFKRKNDDTLRR